MDRRDDLAQFLRARRHALSPGVVGLPAGGRRRTPRLRREEVAILAGVSVTWYTWLEQGRPINASPDVLDSLARTLRLSEAERRHLRTLAEPSLGISDEDPWAAGPPSALARFVDALDPAPAYVLGPAWRILAHNRAHDRLAPAVGRVEGAERNLLLLVFSDPSVMALLADWPTEARRMLAEFRADTAGRRDDQEVVGLVARLRTESADFARWWDEHDVAAFETRLRRFDHPVAGTLTFEHQRFRPVEWPELWVSCLLPLPGDDSAERLAAWRQVG
jgi:transcriptional regulator with XRE-family HTH domain